MKGLETGKDKVKKICEELRKQTLEPAQTQAQHLIDHAHKEAAKIIEDAKKQAQHMHDSTKVSMAKEREMFEASLKQACLQTVEQLKGFIEEKLFYPGLLALISERTRRPDVLAQLIHAIVDAVEKQGLDTQMSAYIPAAVSAREVNDLLAEHVIQHLREKSVLLGEMAGGAEVKLHKEKITLDISAETLKDMVASYVRKDFRDLVFGG